MSLLTDRALWNRCRKNGLDRIGLYSWTSHVARYMHVLDGLEASSGLERALSASTANFNTATPEALRPASLVCVLMDSRDSAEASALAESVAEALRGDTPAALVVSSTLTLDETLKALDKAGVPLERIAAVVADCGATLCVRSVDDAKLAPSEDWAQVNAFRWLRSVAARSVLEASQGSLVLSPAPQVGHICRFAFAPGVVAVPTLHVLQRRLRRKGVRLTLHYAAGAGELRALPLRCSRAMALRWLAQQWQLGLADATVVASATKEPDGDREQALAGLPRVVLVGAEEGAPASNADTEAPSADVVAVQRAITKRLINVADADGLVKVLLQE